MLRRVMREALGLAAVGVLAGVWVSHLVADMLRALLWDGSRPGPLVLTVSALVLVSAMLLASYLPARRAVRIDPLRALRQS